MASVVDRKDKFISDIMAMITNGTSNDVKIVMKDGEILANKDVLSARSDYFATMFSNTKFVEGETSHVTFNNCSKVIMEKIFQYLFSGNVKLHDLSLRDLVKMMNMTTMMLLDDLKADIQQYLLEVIPKSGLNCGSLPDLVESLMLTEQFKLDTIKKTLITELYSSLGGLSHIPDVVKNSDALKNLPYNLLNDIYWGPDKEDEDEDRLPDDKDCFDAFVFWLSENDCTDEEKENIKDFIDFQVFSVEVLLTEIKKSGLYPIDEIDERVLEICRNQDEEMENMKHDLRQVMKQNQALRKINEERINSIKRKNLLKVVMTS